MLTHEDPRAAGYIGHAVKLVAALGRRLERGEMNVLRVFSESMKMRWSLTRVPEADLFGEVRYTFPALCIFCLFHRVLLVGSLSLSLRIDPFTRFASPKG